MNLEEFYFKYPWVLPLFLIWSIFFKGMALWQAAQKRQLSWFLIILVVNTVGLLEILYLLYLNRFDFGSRALLARLERLTKKRPKK